jgi:hypothetical protein
MSSLEKLSERCWSATSKLESQVVRNPDLPQVYRQIVSESFESLRALSDVTDEHKDGPWRISGTTDDGRMLKLSNRHGAVVAHVHSDETAHLLMAISELWAGGDK